MLGRLRASGLAMIGVSVIVAATIPAGATGVGPMLALEPVAIEEPLADTAAEAPPLETLSLGELVQRVGELGPEQLDDELLCLASAVYYEARGEGLEGQLAVAQVIMNRAETGRYGKDICGVVHKPYQFSFTLAGVPAVPRRNGEAWQRARAIAVIASTDAWDDVTDEALYFHANYVKPSWRHRKEPTRQIGRHHFYR